MYLLNRIDFSLRLEKLRMSHLIAESLANKKRTKRMISKKLERPLVSFFNKRKVLGLGEQFTDNEALIKTKEGALLLCLYQVTV